MASVWAVQAVEPDTHGAHPAMMAANARKLRDSGRLLLARKQHCESIATNET
jgi:hypothetical protein